MSARPGERGFTLLELLIAISLLGLIFAALAAGLNFGTQAWRVGGARLAEVDDLSLVSRVMRRQISTAMTGAADAPDQTTRTVLTGDGERLRLIGPAPALSMRVGIYAQEFLLLPGNHGKTLGLSWRNLSNGAAETEPVLHGVRTLAFSYFGPTEEGSPNGERGRWQPRWEDRVTAPLAVKVDIRFVDPDRPVWPSIVIPVRARAE